MRVEAAALEVLGEGGDVSRVQHGRADAQHLREREGGERMGIEAQEEEWGGTHLKGGEVELAEKGLGRPPPAVGGGHENTRAGRGGMEREDKLGRWVVGSGWYLTRSSAKTGAQV